MDVFEVAEEEEDEEEAVEVEGTPEEPAVVTLGRKNKCGLCGGLGHSKKTCTRGRISVNLDDKEEQRLDREDRKNQARITNKAKVKALVEKGASESEIYAMMHDFMTDAEFREALDEAQGHIV